MSVLDSIYNAGARAARAPFSGAAGVVEGGRAIERAARSEIALRLDAALVGAFDALLTRLLEDDVIDRVLDRVESAAVAQRIAERLLDDGIAEQIAERVLAGPEAERLLAATLQGPLVEETVAQLLENQAIWVLVDEIARSPSVTEAIAHQGTGFFDQVAERARDRSRKADTRVQRLAERLGRRRREPPGAGVPERPSLPDIEAP
jgi:hypothetical protein